MTFFKNITSRFLLTHLFYFFSLLHSNGLDSCHLILDKTTGSTNDYQAFLEAEYLRFSGKLPEALTRYQSFLAFNPSPHAHSGLLLLLADLGQHDNVVKHYENEKDKLEEALKSNPSVQLAIAQSYLLINNIEQAEKIFADLAQSNPENEQVAYFATMAFLKTNQLEKAQELIEKCLAKPSLRQKHFLFHFLHAKVCFQKNDLEQAKKSINSCLALSPKFSQALLFNAIVQEQRGLIDDAIKGYEHFLSLAQRDVSTEKHVISLLFSRAKKGDYERAIKYLERINAKTADYYYDLALLHFQNKDNKNAMKNLEQALRINSTMQNAILLKLKVLIAQKSLPKVVQFTQQLIEQHPSNIQILHIYQLLKNMGVPITQLIQAGMATLKKKPSTLLLAAVADLCIEAKDLPNAEKLYGSIMKQSKNALVKARAQYQICYLLFQCGKDTELEQKLVAALGSDAVDPGIYNLLAYHYGTHNKNLDQALSYIEKALVTKPMHAPFLDTKAYVLVKLGKKEDAHAVLEMAHRQAPNDKIIQQRFIALQSML